MRGITEERLKALFYDYQHKFLYSQLEKMYEPHAIMNILHMLVDECKELNAWQPIDENTPKDRRLNLYWKDYGWLTGQWRLGQFFCDANLMAPCNIAPTHWQELPEDPK